MKLALLAVGGLLLFTSKLSAVTAQDPHQDRHAALLVDFSAFDRAYVPALALTKRGALDACRPAMERLKLAWGKLSSKHGRSMPADPAWRTDFSHVGDLIEQAGKRLAEDDQQEAHELLEGVREVLLRTRRRNRIDYYLDHLTTFHGTMEKIVKPATDKAEKGETRLSEAELAELNALLVQAKKEWRIVAKTPLKPGLFAVDPETLQKMVKAEDRALKTLEDALAHGDASAILQAAEAIKPPFARLFMSFGDVPLPPKGTSRLK